MVVSEPYPRAIRRTYFHFAVVRPLFRVDLAVRRKEVESKHCERQPASFSDSKLPVPPLSTIRCAVECEQAKRPIFGLLNSTLDYRNEVQIQSKSTSAVWQAVAVT